MPQTTVERLNAAAAAVDTACREIRAAIADEAAGDGTPESITQLSEHLRQLETRRKVILSHANPPKPGLPGAQAPGGIEPRPPRLAGTRSPEPIHTAPPPAAKPAPVVEAAPVAGTVNPPAVK